ncbi:amidase signature enzyme [Linderina pennispora]|uniref:Amidase signature enzyme n=1 Tax=Linderina pennispora TaxID=61395 RepID=A0A1Y1WGZ2_9FUNG|nr:amidase signature enzyme [Linderina pennispora]ORX72831.1 amidase signature enzyme [Linderina pennispora]
MNGVIARTIAYLIFRPLQVLLWSPWRRLAYAYIRRHNGVPAKLRAVKQLAANLETSLDNYDPILLLSATELARRIRSRELTSEQVVRVYIGRIRKVNPFLNAVVADRFELAIEEARKIDAVLDSGDIPEEYRIESAPFLGVPITIKECIPVEGMPLTLGMPWRQDPEYSPAKESCNKTKNLVSAGFVILGVTNNPELLMAWESDNTIYGRSFNPYDLSRNTGGSSSGEGAIVGAGASVVGLGSDIGGSIRMPAFFCGTFGHKTTASWMPKEVKTWASPRTKEKALCGTTGPICRYAEDIAPFVSSLIGRDIGDPRSVDVSSLKVVAFPEGFGWQLLISSVEPDVRQSIVNVANFLGQQVVGQSNVSFAKMPREFGMATQLYTPYLNTGELSFFQAIVGPKSKPFSWKTELIPFLCGKSKHTFNPFILAWMGGNPAKSLTREKTLPFWNKVDKFFTDLMGDNGVIIFPPHPLKAQPHGISYFNMPNFIYTGLFNILGYPVTQVPVGLSEDGIPLGVQVVAKNGEDLKAIAVALVLEKRFGGWVPPRRFGAPITEQESETLYAHKKSN